MSQNQRSNIQEAVRLFLERIGEDPNREGLLDTPSRVEKMLPEICGGYQEDLTSVVNGAVFHEPADEMILVKDIDFYSLCEHHLLPFFGTAHVAYIPDGKIIGLSKIPRIVDMYPPAANSGAADPADRGCTGRCHFAGRRRCDSRRIPFMRGDAGREEGAGPVGDQLFSGDFPDRCGDAENFL